MTSFQIGNSLFDEAGSSKVAGLVEKAEKNNVKLVFPVDYITADKFDKNAKASCILGDLIQLFILPRLELRLTRTVFPMVGWALMRVPKAANSSRPQFWRRGLSSGTGERITRPIASLAILTLWFQPTGCVRIPCFCGWVKSPSRCNGGGCTKGCCCHCRRRRYCHRCSQPWC